MNDCLSNLCPGSISSRYEQSAMSNIFQDYKTIEEKSSVKSLSTSRNEESKELKHGRSTKCVLAVSLNRNLGTALSLRGSRAGVTTHCLPQADALNGRTSIHERATHAEIHHFAYQIPLPTENYIHFLTNVVPTGSMVCPSRTAAAPILLSQQATSRNPASYLYACLWPLSHSHCGHWPAPSPRTMSTSATAKSLGRASAWHRGIGGLPCFERGRAPKRCAVGTLHDL